MTGEPDATFREWIDQVCGGFPGAKATHPEDGQHDAWTVGGKMFVLIRSDRQGVSVKTDSVATAEVLIAAGIGRRAPYFHRSWVNLPETTAPDELAHRIAESYRLVRAGLTRRQQADLGAWPPSG